MQMCLLTWVINCDCCLKYILNVTAVDDVSSCQHVSVSSKLDCSYYILHIMTTHFVQKLRICMNSYQALFLETELLLQVMNILDSLHKLTSAIQSGNNVALEDYLRHGGDPNADYGMTLLGMFNLAAFLHV
jgi:hypothetical protein